MSSPQNAVRDWIGQMAGRLRFPQLFALAAALFLIDLFIPDFIPFVDEILLALLTLLLGSWKRSAPQEPRDKGGPDADSPVIDVTPDS